MTPPNRLQPLHRIAQRQHLRARRVVGLALLTCGWTLYAAIERAAGWLASGAELLITSGVRLLRHSRDPP